MWATVYGQTSALIAVALLFWKPAAAIAQSNFPQLAAAAKQAADANLLDDATVLYGKALAVRPGWAEGWFSLGTIQYDQNNYMRAARSFEKSLKLDSKSGTARVMLGLCEFELGEDAAALAHLDDGLRLGVADNDQLRNVAVFHKGLLQQRAGKFEAALESLAALCAEGSQSDQLMATIGLATLRLKEKEQTPLATRIGRAECLGDRKQISEAQQEYAALLQENPQIQNIHYAYGRFLLLVVHEPAAAIAEFKKEIENQPTSALARLQIAAAQYRVDSAAGLPYAEQAVQLDPALPLGHYLLGLLLVDTGEDRRAVPELEAARKLLPREAGVYYALGTAYSHTGHKEEAAQARAEFKKLRNEPAVVPQP